MHASLEPRTSLAVAGAAALVAAGTALVPHQVPILPWGLAAAFGVLAGSLHAASVRAVPEDFRRAEDAVAVRKVLMSTAVGRYAVIAQWSCVAVIGALALISNDFIATGLGSYAIFMMFRELTAVRTLFWLTSAGR